jgi:hypothetical protein
MCECSVHKVTAWLLRVHIQIYFYIHIQFLIIYVLFNDQRSNKKSIIYQMFDAPTILFTESQLTLINREAKIT